MTNYTMSDHTKKNLKDFLEDQKSPDLVKAYLYFIGLQHKIEPVVVPIHKTIFKNLDEAIQSTEKENKLWKETEITIHFDKESVNEETQKIYICPFTGKVFGDNTHSNPQDAIYDWVSRCSQNEERQGGLRVKRFLISEDPEMIKNYIVERKKPMKKTVFSSVLNGKLFNSKAAVIKDFCEHYVRPMDITEIQSQNRFQLEEHFLNFIQDQLNEDKITKFVESLSEYPEFLPFIEKWIDSSGDE